MFGPSSSTHVLDSVELVFVFNCIVIFLRDVDEVKRSDASIHVIEHIRSVPYLSKTNVLV